MAIFEVLGAPGYVLTVMMSVHGSSITFSTLRFCFIYMMGILSVSNLLCLNTRVPAFMVPPVLLRLHFAAFCATAYYDIHPRT